MRLKTFWILNLMKKYLDNFYFNLSLSLIWILLSIYLFFLKINISEYSSVLLNDRFVHFTIFFVMTYLLLRTLRVSNFNYNFRSKIILLLSLLVFSFMIEYFQNLTNYRSFELNDIFFNILGIFVCYFVKIK